MANANPRRVTVWLQRAHPVKMPVPTGLVVSERKRIFTALDVLQLALLAQLVEWAEVGKAAIWAASATADLAHHDLVATTFSRAKRIKLSDLGLFIYFDEGSAGRTVMVSQTGRTPIVASIRATLESVSSRLATDATPQPFTLLFIGSALLSIADQLSPAEFEGSLKSVGQAPQTELRKHGR